MYRRRFLRRPRRKILRRRGLGRKRVSKVVKKYVKRELHRNIENKERIDYGNNQTIVINTPTTQIKPLILDFPQGYDGNKRAGNQCKITKGTFKVCVNMLPYNSTSNPWAAPFWVKIWVVRDLKNTGQLNTIDSTALSRFFRGNGGGLSFQNNTLDMNFDVNKDYFRVLYTKIFKVGVASHTSGGDNASSYFDNSPFAKQITINYAKWCKKQLKFDDSNSNANTYPINENLYFVIQTVPASGDSASSGQAMCEMHYVNSCHFEDA